MKCHAGCALPDILAALSLEEGDLFVREEKAPRRRSDLGPIVASYPYVDEKGVLLYQTTRHDPKDFRQRRPDPTAPGGWRWGLDGVRRVLFRLPDVLAAVTAGRPVYVTEGEKDALSLVSLGLDATCNPMGAGKWKDDFSVALAGADVVIVADRDETGRKHAQAVALSLHGRAASVRIVEVPTGKDPADFVASGATREDFERLVAAVPPWQPVPGPRPVEAPVVAFEWIPAPPPRPRPTLPDAALYGLAGRWVRTVAPHTEGDPLGLLTAFLVRFGVAVGRRPHYRVGGTRHGTNLFGSQVGPTSTGRKGSADAEAERTFRIAGCVPPTASGLSSGEGLIFAVRDEIKVMRPVKERGRTVDHEEVVEDPGVSDKRLLVVESELGSVLRRMERDGNSLSPVMRQAWDSANLRVLTKKSVTATEPHVGLMASITPSELETLLSEGETLNGWGNRILWVDVHRPHLLPGGGNLRDHDLVPLAQELRQAVERGTGLDELRMDAPAFDAWERIYPQLTADRPGTFGAMTARAPQHVLRLALVYAVLDGSPAIQRQHLRAGLGFWQAAEESARGLFGSQLGDRVAESILAELSEAGPDGLTRSEIRDALGRNVSSPRIGQALALLARWGMAHGRRETRVGRGRPSERWFSERAPQEKNADDAVSPPEEGNTASKAFILARAEKASTGEASR